MNTFSKIDSDSGKIKKFVGKNLKKEVCSVEALNSWNSGVFKVICGDGEAVLVKAYNEDNKNRADVEFGALDFLFKRGFRKVPAPLFRDEGNKFCAYEYIDGKKLKTEDIGPKEIKSAVSLLVEIALLAHKTEYGDLPEASEACFSFKRYVENIDWRISCLKKEAKLSGDARLKDFLEKDISVFRDEVVEYIKNGVEKYKLNYEEELNGEERILSPSDVGFHNILSKESGELFFIDFEYFGWDDPAKTVSDFLLEPAVPFPDEYRSCFIENFRDKINTGENFKKRLSLIYPLLGLKWSLIILNDYLPNSQRRGKIPAGKFRNHLDRQLDKSKKKLEKTVGEYKKFAKLVEEVL